MNGFLSCKEVRIKGSRVALLALLVLPVICLAAANAFGATESGYLSGAGASYSFAVNGPVDVTFGYPKGSVDFWVSVTPPTGGVTNYDLDNGEIIQLLKGGTYYLTIYSNWGAGYWSAAWGGGGGYSPGSCNVGGNSAWGYLNGSGDSCSFTIDSYVQTLNMNFVHPGNSVDFWVEVVGKDGRTVSNNVDLSSSGGIQLIGGGRFYITVYSNRGSGNWSCSW